MPTIKRQRVQCGGQRAESPCLRVQPACQRVVSLCSRVQPAGQRVESSCSACAAVKSLSRTSGITKASGAATPRGIRTRLGRVGCSACLLTGGEGRAAGSRINS